jgi:hypothetical protein
MEQQQENDQQQVTPAAASLSIQMMSAAEKVRYFGTTGLLTLGGAELIGMGGYGLLAALAAGGFAAYWSEEIRDGIVDKLPVPKHSSQSRRSKLQWLITGHAIQPTKGAGPERSLQENKSTYRLPEAVEAESEDEWDDVEVEDEEEDMISEGMTFRELFQLDVIQKAIAEKKMIIGFENGVLRYGTWKDFNSAACGGVSGSGKTTTIRWLLLQTILLKGRFIMIDPHIHDQEQSLAAQFRIFKQSHVFPPCDDNGSAVTKRIRWLMKEYLRRKEGGKGPAIVFVIDELNELIRYMTPELRKDLTDLLLTIAQGGRKFGLYALLIGQRWSEQDLGGKPWGAAIRTSLSSMMAHRFTDEDQAKKLLGTKNGPRCLDLETGHWFFRDTEGRLSEIVTPDTGEDDMKLVLKYLGYDAPVPVEQEHPIQRHASFPEPQQETVMVTPDRFPGWFEGGQPVVSPYYEQTNPMTWQQQTMSPATSIESRYPLRETTSINQTVKYPVEAAFEESGSGFEVAEASRSGKVALTEREKMIGDMFFAQEMNPSSIAKKICGATGGTEYQKASVEVADAIRAYVSVQK